MNQGEPNLCVDIFSQMANMLASFNINIQSADPQIFSHDSGFTSTIQNTLRNSNFEEQFNNQLYIFFVGAMVLFLIYQQTSNAVYNARLNLK